MSKQQKWAWIFTILFFIVVVITNVPAFTDENGYNFGLFKIDPIDNIIHGLTFIVGVVAAWWGARSASWWLILGGLLYELDAAAGIFTQRGLLDQTVFTSAWLGPDFGLTNFLINAPHIVISTIMIVLGYKGLKMLKRA